MSANNAEPTGEVKDNPDEPILGDNGVNYDSYATEGDTTTQNSTDINFDSADIEKHQKTEYFVNVEGAEKRKREEERQAKKNAERRIKLIEQNKGNESIQNAAQAKDKTESIVRKMRRESFVKKYSKKVLIISTIAIVAITAIVIAIIAIANNVSKDIKNDNIARSYGDVFKEIEVIRSRYGRNTDEYYDAMQDLIDKSEYDETRARILLYRAEDLSSFEDKALLEKALADAYESEKLDPTSDSAYWISNIEGKLGNEEKSKEYEEIKNNRVNDIKIDGIG